MPETLTAAVRRAVITPPLGIEMLGYHGREGYASSVESDLTATACVLGYGGRRVAVVALDIALLKGPLLDELLARLGQAIGTTTHHVLLNFSHTHSGPMFPGWMVMDEAEPEQPKLQQRYFASLLDAVEGIAREAARSLEPVRVGYGVGECFVNVQRREKRADGSVFLGEVPDGPADRDVPVLRVDRLDGSPLAVMFGYACHPIVLGMRSTALSPDFVGRAREFIERSLGCTALFLQGAGGDMNPTTGIGYYDRDVGDLQRLGYTLGAEALKVAVNLQTHRRRAARDSHPTLATVSVWPYEPVEDDRPHILQAAGRTLDLPLMPLPDLATAQDVLERNRRDYEAACAAGERRAILTAKRRYVVWAELLLETARAGKRDASVPVHLVVLQIDDVALVGVAGELFSQIGRAIKERSPIRQTAVFGYSNGDTCYLPTDDALPEDWCSPYARYEIPDLLYQQYMVPFGLRPGVADRVTDGCLDLLHSLHSAQS